MTSKFCLYNFSLANVYQTLFYNVCAGQTNCFYFCPYFYENFISDPIPFEAMSINVKMKSAAVVWCAEQNYVLKQIQWRKRRIFLRIWKIFDSVLLCFQEKWVSGRYSIENFVEISLPGKHLLVLKTSSRHVLKTSCKDVLKTCWRRLGRPKIATLKTS